MQRKIGVDIMKCLVCENSESIYKNIDENLKGFVCGECQGVWIPAKAYWNWLHTLHSTLPEKPESETVDLPVRDSDFIKICPDCGHFLSKRKVGHGLPFNIDRCQCCGGVWLDQNEWEVLKSRNLHDAIHLMFSQEWQEEILQEEQEKAYEDEIEKILGFEDYHYLKDFTDKYKLSPRKDVILAYVRNALMDKE
jgi:Zn-finger nucleic acid-binding protein